MSIDQINELLSRYRGLPATIHREDGQRHRLADSVLISAASEDEYVVIYERDGTRIFIEPEAIIAISFEPEE